MAVYVIKCNTLSGCLEPTKVSGNESVTLGCVWNSTDVAATINDCDGCQLAQLNQTSVALGLGATALNNGVSVGKSSSTTCTAIALGCGATATDNGIAIGANLTACCDEILIGDKVIIADNTVINGCDGGCSNVVAINATATDNCQVVINGLVDVTCASVTLGCVATVDTKVALGNSATAAADSVAIGSNASATCGINIKGGNSEVTLDFNNTVTIGTSNTVCNTGNTVIGTALVAGSGTTDTVIIGQANNIPDACNISEAVVIGDLGEIGVDYVGSISSGDVILGGYLSGPFKYCASNGYTYSNECLMTGRILECAACLPASNCSLLLYYVP